MWYNSFSIAAREDAAKGEDIVKIAIGNDHVGVEMKNFIRDLLVSQGHEVINFGTDDTSSSNYPVYAEKVAKAVVSGECDRGVLICGTGLGISISANKIHGVRCAVCSEPVSARLSREHNNANIIAFGARIIGPIMAQSIVETFLTTDYEGGRHQKRLDMIAKLERDQTLD